MADTGKWHGDAYYFGLHYDLHANANDTDLGAKLNPAELAESLKRMDIDFAQTDCKGHPGMTSWFSRLEAATVSPGVKKDALTGWRDATAMLNIPLHCHYSGIWDKAAAQKHPEWAIVPNPNILREKGADAVNGKMCPRRGYLDGLLIPQMLELIDRYHVDGFWVDGDLWAVEFCYCDICRKEFRQQTGIEEPPLETTDPNWAAWMRFQKEGFLKYVTAYCEAVHAHKPGVLVCSNWLQTFHDPGEPVVPTDWISGDNRCVWGYDTSRCEARFISTRGKPWDIMLWAFYGSHGMAPKDSPRTFKPPQMLMQEAAVSLALGGNIQIYEHPQGLRDGRLADWRMKRLGQVGEFVKKRRAVCQGTETIPQIAVLHSEHHMHSQPVTNLHWGFDTTPVEGAVFGLLEKSYSVDILDEWALKPAIDAYPLIVSPEQDELSGEMVAILKDYVERGGKLLLSGAPAIDRFGSEFIGAVPISVQADQSYYIPAADGNTMHYSRTWTLLKATDATPFGRLGESCLTTDKLTDFPAAVINTVGRGMVAYAPFELFHFFQHNRYPLTGAFIGELVQALNPDFAIRVVAPVCVDVILRKKGDRTIVNLINRSSGIPNIPNNGAVDFIPEVGPVTVTMPVSTGKTVSEPLEDGAVTTSIVPTPSGDVLTITLQRFRIHAAIVVE